MGKQKNEKKSTRKKEIRNMIYTKLDAALSDFKTAAGEKKYGLAIKKGTRLLSRLLHVKVKKQNNLEMQELID